MKPEHMAFTRKSCPVGRHCQHAHEVHVSMCEHAIHIIPDDNVSEHHPMLWEQL